MEVLSKDALKGDLMGQYYVLVNLDKKEFLHPHAFGNGLKLLEFGDSSSGTMTGLAILLADGNGRGGGDLHSQNPIIGSWAGDRIVIAGDYADEGKWGLEPTETLYSRAHKCYHDISVEVMTAMADDKWLRQGLLERRGHFGSDDWLVPALTQHKEGDS